MLSVLTHRAAGGVAVFSGRLGGVSSGAYATANLSSRVGDDHSAVQENRRRLIDELGVSTTSLVTVPQRHTSTVVEIGADPEADQRHLPAGADGMITRQPGTVLMIGTADCVPVALLGPGAVAIVHAGRRGILAGIVTRALHRMAEAGVRSTSVTAVVGPAIGGCCYEVDAGTRAEFLDRYPRSAATSRRGGPAVDLRTAVETDLRAADVDTIVHAGDCTAHEPGRYFSARRDKVTGYQAGVVVLCDSAG